MDESPVPDDVGVPKSGPWRSYKERVALIAQRIVDAQRPIRVLNSIKWPAEVYAKFQSSGWREMPQIGPAEYEKIALGFHPQQKFSEFREIEASVRSELGSDDAIGRILAQTAHEYAELVEMLECRGSPRFYELSRRLYGSAKELFSDDVTRVRDVALDMYQSSTCIKF